MFLAGPRALFMLAFVASSLVMGGSFYLERVAGLVPCSLCVMQRFFLASFCLLTLIAGLLAGRRHSQRLYAALCLLCSLAGAATAARQVLLQRVPMEELMICQPHLHNLIRQVPPLEALSLMYRATAECAQIKWTLFDMSIPEWSLLAFIGLSLMMLYQVAGQGLRGDSRCAGTADSRVRD